VAFNVQWRSLHLIKRTCRMSVNLTEYDEHYWLILLQVVTVEQVFGGTAPQRIFSEADTDGVI